MEECGAKLARPFRLVEALPDCMRGLMFSHKYDLTCQVFPALSLQIIYDALEAGAAGVDQLGQHSTKPCV